MLNCATRQSIKEYVGNGYWNFTIRTNNRNGWNDSVWCVTCVDDKFVPLKLCNTYSENLFSLGFLVSSFFVPHHRRNPESRLVESVKMEYWLYIFMSGTILTQLYGRPFFIKKKKTRENVVNTFYFVKLINSAFSRLMSKIP